MSETNSQILAAEETIAPRVSYWTIVWAQFRKNPVAIFGMWAVVGLFLLAIYAPLIALDQPFVLRTAEGAQYPFFGSLFNRLFFENGVDIFFNLLMVASPVYLIGFLVGRRFGRAKTVGLILAFHLVLFVSVAGKSYFGFDNPFYRSAKVVNYVELAEQAAAAGEDTLAIFPPRPVNFRATDPTNSLAPPSAAHWLGTDREGRDVFARLLYGTRISLTIGVVAVSIYVVIGVVLGAISGYYGGKVDIAIQRIIEIMMCFPTFFLILTLAAVVENRSIFHVMVIIGIVQWTGVARLVRAEFLKQKNLDYVQAAIALGLPKRRIIFRHVLPNAIAPVLVAATFGVAAAILTESGLSFLGLGDPSAPSWGGILNAGRLEQKLWLILAPGFAIFFVVSVLNLVGEGLRDALDPKLRK